MSVNTPAEAAAKLRVLALRVATPFTANPETETSVEAGAKLLQTMLAAAAPKRTGAYAQTISTRTNVSVNAAFIRGEGAAPLTNWLIGGTRAHDIVPKSKKALFWPGALHPVKRVYHPGTKPNPWHVAPSNAAADLIGGFVADAMLRSMADAI